MIYWFDIEIELYIVYNALSIFFILKEVLSNLFF